MKRSIVFSLKARTAVCSSALPVSRIFLMALFFRLHHGDLLEAVFVMHLAMDHVQADIDHVAGDALVATVPIEREEPLHHGRFQVGTIQRHQGRKG